ncbi:MAG: glycoside hydrolase family 140 protein [Prolixibacteraceae bacterium]|jgi:hypothetical protein|nr:glycoside hydrolase family 140 protein [Prolixibacteraceae bacterium]MDI9565098.1 glycoside hydrolase family 140 protein [Bacteroidota bacterium]NLT00542.1 DUF4038 domain-containing protein [Bacteroidales bacterium]OQB81263.1 MAG: putative endoglucanase [Bacteroidetes bacterium ADurb.Bin123]HNZ68940.1 glycoside hydrolase family 140 protein [Prolixibacteraceae bacterium]
MRNYWFFILLFMLLCGCQSDKDSNGGLPLLQVSPNGRFLMGENGNPFFWLGDTGWLLFSKLTREEADFYLQKRKEQGFNVIQVMVLHSLDVVNAYGDSALVCGDPSRPLCTPGAGFEDEKAYDFWDHADYIVDQAGKRGIYMALVPVWGSNVKKGAVSRDQADFYSSWLAERYAGRNNVIWLNGGDIRGSDSTAVWNIIGNNLREKAPGHLITFHPFGRMKSSMWFHNAPWLDFNMFQSGHRRYDQDDTALGYGQDNWKYARDDYALLPVKPTLDGEPSYESIPQGLHDATQPYWTAADVRRYAWWSVLAGGFGFTYGHNAVMQMHKPGDQDSAYGVKEYWRDALDFPGASAMVHLKNLMLDYPFFERIPDSSLIAGSNGEKYDYLAASRGRDYAFVYTYTGRGMEINLGILEGDSLRASWYSPSDGRMTPAGTLENTGTALFNPPGEPAEGNDWVLVLESGNGS